MDRRYGVTNVCKNACDVKNDKSNIFPHCQIQNSLGIFTFLERFFGFVARYFRIQCPGDGENDENDTSHAPEGASPAKCINERLAHWAHYK